MVLIPKFHHKCVYVDCLCFDAPLQLPRYLMLTQRKFHLLLANWCSLPATSIHDADTKKKCIVQVGEGVTKFVKGQRVVPLVMLSYFKNGQGTWQDYILVDEANAFPVPPSVSDEVAAQFIVNPWTAMGLMEKLAVPKGEYILQTAAASSMGRWELLSPYIYIGKNFEMLSSFVCTTNRQLFGSVRFECQNRTVKKFWNLNWT